MKPTDPLDHLLQSWQPDGRAPEDFRDVVWGRIAAQAGGAGETVTGWAGPRRALAACAAAVVLGFSLGFLIPNDSSESAREAYFVRINPLVRVR